MRITKVFIIIGLCFILAAGVGVAADKKLKAGFIYVGPVGDYGWSHAHDMGRKFAEQKLPWLETVYIESVPEADSPRIIDRLIQGEPMARLVRTLATLEEAIIALERRGISLKMHATRQDERAGIRRRSDHIIQ